MANLIVGMLCLHLLCFGVMFWLISTRLQEGRLGMDVFALGNAMLGLAYVLQLLGGPPGWSASSVLNHTLTLCAPVVYWIGGMRFFGRPAPLLGPLLALAAGYALAQVLVQWLLGPVARYALLALASALIFAAMAGALLQAVRTIARDVRVEMLFFAVLIAGLGILNAAKFVRLLHGGLAVLDMGLPFQKVFYAYMTFLTAVLAPATVWLVLRRLTDALRATAARDPLTQLLNRRGLLAALTGHFGARTAGPARLLMLDIDHFKRINDTHGHQAGDLVLCQVAQVLRETVRHGDPVSRLGGEEFVVISLGTDEAGALRLAERLRAAIAAQAVPLPGSRAALHCSVTIGVSQPFHDPQGLDGAMQQADAALYRGKAAGRNRVELGEAGELGEAVERGDDAASGSRAGAAPPQPA